MEEKIKWSQMIIVNSTRDEGEVWFDNVLDSRVTPDTFQHVFCGKAASYLFWDGQHPTKAGHEALAAHALQQMTSQ